MPDLFSDALDSLYDTWWLALAYWGALPDITRLIISLLAAAGVVYLATQAEETGWSSILFFAAFGIFAYVMLISYSMFR